MEDVKEHVESEDGDVFDMVTEVHDAVREADADPPLKVTCGVKIIVPLKPPTPVTFRLSVLEP